MVLNQVGDNLVHCWEICWRLVPANGSQHLFKML